MDTSAYVSRQPIYNRNMAVYAYELLFRSGPSSTSAGVAGDRATAEVILNLIDIGLEHIIGNEQAFVNVTRNFLVEGYCRSLPIKSVVLEVLEDIRPDIEVVENLRKLRAEGYQIALDDFVCHDHLRPLVELADIVKVDLLAQDREKIERTFEMLREHDVRILAEKVETQSDYDFCHELGFDYFQGYFFCRPRLIQGKKVPTNRMAATRLVARLQDPDITGEQIARAISQDLTLSYRLLRLANSAYASVSRKVESIEHAAMLIGTDRIRTWASLLMMSSMDDKPRELMMTAAIRAGMSERLASGLGMECPRAAFTTGLFSVLDAMLDSPFDVIVDKLPLSDEITRALEAREGPLGQLLNYIIAYEQDDEAGLSGLGGQLGVSLEMGRDAYMDSVAWTRETFRELGL